MSDEKSTRDLIELAQNHIARILTNLEIETDLHVQQVHNICHRAGGESSMRVMETLADCTKPLA